MGTDHKSAYAAAGVDIDRKMGAIDRFKEIARKASTPAVLAGIGNFGGLYDASLLQTAAAPVLVDEDYLANKRKQTLGHVFLGSGLGIAVVGTILIEIDSWGNIGKVGFASIGAGLGISFVGMFLLGFSRPVHDLKPRRRVSAAPTSDGRGAVLAYERTF